MALLLHIDTATSYGAVAISNDDDILYAVENSDQKEHAFFLHPAIQQVLERCKLEVKQLDAVSVTIGPGSYTGLRVALSAAKGICYTIQKPLIAVSTLQAIALATSQTVVIDTTLPILYAPMIDARRMEVFTALFTTQNEMYSQPQAMVLDENTYAEDIRGNFIVFSGDGAKKFSNVLSSNNILISNTTHTIGQVASIASRHFKNNTFENIAYCEPFYLKPFYMTGFVKK
jgi:tRNA threonylcarbamoyladenosine biosynthesis protein TsaB